jgi:serine/threonine protein kinase/TPR repeat protein
MDSPSIIGGVYRLQRQLGSGGMGTVHLAEVDLNRFDYTKLYTYTQVQGATHRERRAKADELARRLQACPVDPLTVRRLLQAQNIPVPGQYVAIKLSAPHGPAQRFTSEWQYLLCLSHPHMVSVYDGGEHQGQLFYAMEWLNPLIPFEQVVTEFPLRHKLRLMQQAAMGLAFMHRSGLVHRDVKPPNILISGIEPDNATAKISDLGLAKDLSGDGLTLSEQVMGTPRYMAPEQFVSARHVDRRADVYALGAVLYCLVTGNVPYQEHSSVYAIMQAMGRREPCTPPRQLDPHLPPIMDAIVSCAMAWEPAARYADMETFAADLQIYLDSENPGVLDCSRYRQAAQLRRPSTADRSRYHCTQQRAAQPSPVAQRHEPPPPQAALPARPKPVLLMSIAGGLILICVVLFIAGFVILANRNRRAESVVMNTPPPAPPTPAPVTPSVVPPAPPTATTTTTPAAVTTPQGAPALTAEELYQSALKRVGGDITTRSDYTAAAKLLREAARQGHHKAQTKLGFYLLNGLGIDRDYEDAERYFRDSAASGESEAMAYLALIYLNGFGKPKDLGEARQWALKALTGGFDRAQEILDAIDTVEKKQARLATPQPGEESYREAFRYINGMGVKRDVEKGIQLLRDAANAGYGQAMNDIGALHLSGEAGIPLDRAMAAQWFRKAAAAGCTSSEYNLKLMRQRGWLDE